MSDWYMFAVLALFFMGVQRFLYKVSAEKNCNTAWTTFSFMGTVAATSSALFIALGEPVPSAPYLLLISLVNSSTFFAATVTHIEALKHIPASVVYPLIRLSAAVVVAFSILYFQDRPTLFQGMGIVLSIAVALLLTRRLGNGQTSDGNAKIGLLLAFVALFSGSIAAISSKFAAIHSNRLGFIAVSYIMATFFSFGFRARLQTHRADTNQRNAVIIGCVMGLTNFAGFYAFLKALSIGPLSIIVSITGMHFIIPIILSVWIYNEKLTPSRILCIVLAVLSIILLRL